MHAQGIVPKLHCPYSKYLLPKITYAHSQYFINIQNFLLFYSHICTLESQSHVMHTLAFIWKGIFMPSIYIWKAIPRHIFILGSILVPHSNMCTFIKHLTTYSTYTCFIWRVFVSCYLFYIYMYMVNNIFTPSRRKENIKVQPKPKAGLKGESSPTCSHFHALLYWNQKLGFLGLESHSGTYSSSYKLSEHSKMAAIYAQIKTPTSHGWNGWMHDGMHMTQMQSRNAGVRGVCPLLRYDV